MLNLAIEHLVGQQRFQVIVEGEACLADYRLRDGVMAIVHTEVAPRLNGRGIAGARVQAALDHAHAQGLEVNPVCSYAATYMHRHPEPLAWR
jgi:predicted GNAT family acetyltransferase